ncbi:hypothetical protein [Pseudomonas frederiksbergensis]|uniref:hypothetical protein n=1 Tax=Pseudomonas frederiksbergensis TaxID=104087 RepID=UPI003D1B5FC0
MNLQRKIDEVFAGKAFERPLFYSCPGGLRFSLSEKGTAIELFSRFKKHDAFARTFSLTKDRSLCVFVFAPGQILLHSDLF